MSGDLLAWDAALAMVSGFLVAAAQAGVLTAHGVAGERAAVCHWLGMTLAWTVMWLAWLVAPAITRFGPAFHLLWSVLPWLIFEAISSVWLLAPVRLSLQPPPIGDGTLRLLAGLSEVEAASGDALRAIYVRRAAVAASDRREAA